MRWLVRMVAGLEAAASTAVGAASMVGVWVVSTAAVAGTAVVEAGMVAAEAGMVGVVGTVVAGITVGAAAAGGAA